MKAWFKHYKDEIIVFSCLFGIIGSIGWLFAWMEYLSPLAKGLKEMGL